MFKQETKATLERACLYSLPLAMVYATMQKSTNAAQAGERNAPVNQLFHHNKLADSNSKLVVTPNVDTVYSQAFLDLSREAALVLEKPKTDRYYAIQVMNAYSDTIAVLGTGNDGQGKQAYLFTREGYKGDVPKGVKRVTVNTDLIWVVARIVCDGERDLRNVSALQKSTRLLPLKNYVSGKNYAPEAGQYDKRKDFVPVNHVMQMSAKAFFDQINRLMVGNPPQKQDEEITKVLAAVNVGAGKTFDPSVLGEDPEGAWDDIKKAADKNAIAETARFNTRNGIWSYFDKPIGDFGTEYGYRGLVALRGLGANPVEAAIYAKTSADSTGAALSGKNAYKIHFEPNALPPVEKYGFWSITVYGQDDFLIPNKENKYAITDRTPFVKNADGSVDLYVSKELPVGVDKANWLPVSDNAFHLFLRIYLPAKEVRNGTWNTPAIELAN